MSEVWTSQLTQIHGVSFVIAKSIVSKYPTVKSLTKVLFLLLYCIVVASCSVCFLSAYIIARNTGVLNLV